MGGKKKGRGERESKVTLEKEEKDEGEKKKEDKVRLERDRIA